MPSLPDLPVEVLLDNVLPFVPIPDLLSFACTSKSLAAVCADDTFWKRKCADDFNFTSSETARTTGWRVLYRGLSHPKVFVWGERRNGRMGTTSLPKNTGWGVPYPLEVKFPSDVRIVSLIAGGMSFHALDSHGGLYVWGTLDGQNMALNSEGFAMKYKEASVSHKLILPAPIRSVSTGRIHAMALDSDSQVWTFLSWGRPFKFDSALLDCRAPDTTPVQVECGWAFSSILTQSGDVLVYWPFAGAINTGVQQENTVMNENGDNQARATHQQIPCVTWTLRADPFRLPPIPQLPELSCTEEEEVMSTEVKLIKIASFDNNLIGLTNKGHVLKYGELGSEGTYRRGGWQYLPNYSEVSSVREQPAFSAKDSQLAAPTAMKITHISAHFHTFVAYSTGASSIILMGHTETNDTSAPKIIPAIQNRSIISVVLGDYHYGALTSFGELLTWGSYSHGALGLGYAPDVPVGEPGGYATEEDRNRARGRFNLPDPPAVETPAVVHFDRGASKGKKFCFAATAAGWHTGALVIDLEPGKEKEEQRMPGQFPSDPSGSQPEEPDQTSLSQPGGGLGLGRIFRIGFAGRGAHLAVQPRGRGAPM